MAIRRASDFSSPEGNGRPDRTQRSARADRSERAEQSDRSDRRRDRGAGDTRDTSADSARPRRVPIDQMSRTDQVEHAKNSALNTLSMVAKTRGELEERLTTKGYPDDVIAEALDRLVEVGLVDDAAYAEGYAASRQRSRGLTSGAIRRELQRKKLDPDIIEAALTQISDEDEKAKAIEMVERKVHSTRNLDTQARIRRLASMLIRKGYSPGLAFTVVKDALAREGENLTGMDTLTEP